MNKCISRCSIFLPFPLPGKTNQQRCKSKLPPGGVGPIDHSNLGNPFNNPACHPCPELDFPVPGDGEYYGP